MKSFVLFIFFSLSNIEIAFSLTETILSLLIKPKKISKSSDLRYQPRVAILYVTYNDYMPHMVDKLDKQIYENFDIFILDDSDNDEIKKLIDLCKFKIVRRKNRKGFKAGNINNWIRLFSSDYKYFIVVDADSYLPSSFLIDMIRHAEHKDNQKIALFQSKIKIWNLRYKFPSIISTCNSVQIFIWERILNKENMIPLGNNCLYRTSILRSIGGFVEDFVAEDLATGIRLIENGYVCQLVDVISYEMTPESIKSYTKRNIRWATQTLEIILKNEGKISFITKVYVLSFVYKSLMGFNAVAILTLVVWGYSSSVSDFKYFINMIFTSEVITNPLIYPLTIVAIYWIYFLFGRLPLIIRNNISIIRYYRFFILNISLDFYNLFPMLIALFKTFIGKKVPYMVTDKKRSKLKLHEILIEMKFSIIFLTFILLGLLNNPFSIIFNIFWLTLFLISPFILYKSQCSDI